MDLGNPIEIVVHYFQMAWLDYWDRFLMVSALLYVMHIGQDLW